MRSPNGARWRRLFGKDRRELAGSRAWIVLLVIVGPLVGHAFITAADGYASGASTALSHGQNPLDGIIVPTLGAYAIAVMVLYPFVAIRLVSSEKENGSLKLLLQTRTSLGTMLSIKMVVLVAGWIVASMPGIIALVLWHLDGGGLAGPEVAAVLLGHLLRTMLICSIAIAAASLTGNAAIAALVTLAITLGAWAVDFVARLHGGIAQVIDGYTAESALRSFERGEIRIALVIVAFVLSIGLLGLAMVWLHPGRRRRTRIIATALVVATTSVLVWLGAQQPISWDLSAVAGITAPTKDAVSAYPGYSPVAHTVGAPLIFYLVWPSSVLAIWLSTRRTRTAPSPKKAARS